MLCMISNGQRSLMISGSLLSHQDLCNSGIQLMLPRSFSKMEPLAKNIHRLNLVVSLLIQMECVIVVDKMVVFTVGIKEESLVLF